MQSDCKHNGCGQAGTARTENLFLSPTAAAVLGLFACRELKDSGVV